MALVLVFFHVLLIFCTYTSCHSLARSLFLEFGGSQTSSWLALPGWISGGIQIWFLAYLSGFPMRGFLFYVDKVKIQRAMPIVLTLKVWLGPSSMFSSKRKLVGSNSDGNRYHKRTLRYNSLKKFKSSGSWQIKTINKKLAWFNKSCNELYHVLSRLTSWYIPHMVGPWMLPSKISSWTIKNLNKLGIKSIFVAYT